MSSRWNSDTLRWIRSSAASSTASVVLPAPERPSTAIMNGLAAAIEGVPDVVHDARDRRLDHVPAGVEIGVAAEPRVVNALVRRAVSGQVRIEGTEHLHLLPGCGIGGNPQQGIVVVHVQGEDQVAVLEPQLLKLPGTVGLAGQSGQGQPFGRARID